MPSRIAPAWIRQLSWLFSVLILSWCYPALSLSQVLPDGSIRGIVRDEQGAVLSGVTVTAVSDEVPGEYTATTDSTGLFRLANLPPADYSVHAIQANFAPFLRDHVVVRAGLNIGLDIALKLGTVQDTIRVVADTPLLETSSASTTFNVSGDLQRGLPTSPRSNWSDALILTPGVISADATFGGLTQYYIAHGSNSGSHVLQVDGADISSATISQPFYVAFDTDLIADVQIKTAGVDASTPIGTGAVVSVAAKSGTNRLAGSAGLTYQGKSWNSSNVVGGSSPAVSLVQPDLSVGGPIVRDRFWYFGAYRRVSASTGVARTAAQVSNLRQLSPGFDSFDLQNRANLYFGRLTSDLHHGQSLSGFYESDFMRTDSGGPQDAAPLTSQIGGRAAAARLSSVWTSALTSETRVSYNDKTYETPEIVSSVGAQTVYRRILLSSGRWAGQDSIARIGSPASVWSDQPARKLTTAFDVTYFKSQSIGSNEFKAGIFLQPILDNESTLHYVNGGTATELLVLKDPNDPSSGLTPFRRIVFPPSVVQYRSSGSDLSFYAQDAWHFGRLTTTVGLRVDRVQYKDTVFNVTTQKSVDVGPRVGVTYALRPDGRSIARFTWGRVPDRVAGAAFAGTTSATITSQYDLNLDGTFETVDVIPGQSALSRNRIFDADLHQPYVNEITAGFRQQLAGRVMVDIGVVRRLMKDPFTMLETNGIYNGSVFAGYVDQSQNEIYKLTNNQWNWPVYTALELIATKRISYIDAVASYTRQWQRLEGTWQPNDPASFIQPASFPNDRGIGDSTGSLSTPTNSLSGSSMSLGSTSISPWQEHLVRTGIVGHLPYGVTIAGNYTYQSGPWSGPIVQNLSAPDPAFGPPTVTLANGRSVQNPLATIVRFAYPTRADGQFHLGGLHILNVRVAKSVELGRNRITFTADVFNATNNDADQRLLSGGNLLGSANYGVGQNRQAPRGAQLGAKLTF